MPFVFFHKYFPQIAPRETRSLTILKDSPGNLPPATYEFVEMYCDERGCDCRRVFFFVLSSVTLRPEAVITWGWESRDFYVRWMGDDDPLVIDSMMGPSLNIGSPQSEHAYALLELTRDVLLKDALYVERIKRHYALFRSMVEKGGPRIPPRARGQKGKRRR